MSAQYQNHQDYQEALEDKLRRNPKGMTAQELDDLAALVEFEPIHQLVPGEVIRTTCNGQPCDVMTTTRDTIVGWRLKVSPIKPTEPPEEELNRMWRNATNTGCLVHMSGFFQIQCGVFADAVVKALQRADPKTFTFRMVESKETWPTGTPLHMGVLVWPVSATEEDGAIWDAWPDGVLREYGLGEGDWTPTQSGMPVGYIPLLFPDHYTPRLRK